MYHASPFNATFWAFLFTIDQDLAETARRQGCPCGGRLHRADYPRKPRGGPDTPPATYKTRFSFCCDRDGCRKASHTPVRAVPRPKDLPRRLRRFDQRHAARTNAATRP